MLTRGSRNGGATYGLWEFKRPRDQRLSYLVTPVRDPVRVQFSHKGQLSDLQRHDACFVASERVRLLSEAISAFALQYQSHCIILNGNARSCTDNEGSIWVKVLPLLNFSQRGQRSIEQ
ncbi:hypothetical protein FOYG_08111 [Fusarium oxysporum NRRL 32931]|uniref:Uncharacterized protein n=1 Tax=Fusarium oxysporum NRRL 32931 TaxID=660029 RepID=W9I730_FUSOX|nr:hypothetical protein FOYG_08111 [Fusarium oxysporum NRRL 32931]EWY90684.1 hypothetical protein FOYG_08111 [Fusarium oxysporum NRRL 32931]